MSCLQRVPIPSGGVPRDGWFPLRILVVGAGIAGLAVARALRLAGFRPDVTERLPPTESIDTGLYLPGNAARAMRRLDLDGPLRPLGQVIHRQRFLDAAGAPLCEVDLDALWAGVGSAGRCPGPNCTGCCSPAPAARCATVPR